MFNVVKRALLLLSSDADGNIVKQLVADAYSRLRTAAVDEDLAFISAALLNSSSAVQLSAETAPGYLTVVNLDTNTIYLGPSTVTATGATVGLALPAGGGPFTMRVTNPSAWYAIGGAASNTVSAMVSR